jgi:hypothetical protein
MNANLGAAVEPRTPRLASLRVPSDLSLVGMIGNAHTMWRLASKREPRNAPESGNPVEEYRNVCDFMRLYATLRFYQLALLLGTSGSIVTALSSTAVRASFARAEFLRAGGLIVSVAFLVMEFRASSYWHRLRDRANDLARALRFQRFPVSSRWNPLTTSGVSFYLHATLVALWIASAFLRLQPGF